MKRFRSLLLVFLGAALLVAIALPALAADHGESESEHDSDTATTTTAVAEIINSDGDTPAVIVPPDEPKELEQPWTARYLIPLLVVSAILTLAAVVIIYNRTVRHRYHVTG